MWTRSEHYMDCGPDPMLSSEDGMEEDAPNPLGQSMIDLDGDDWIPVAGAVEFPDPICAVLDVPGRDQFMRFDPDMVPSSLPKVRPEILEGLSSIKDITEGCKALCCMHNCMPMPVHASPLVALFMSRMVEAKHAAKPKCISWMYSCFQLHQFRTACINSIIPFHKDVTAEVVRNADQAYLYQVKLLEREHEEGLADMYERAAAAVNAPEGRAAFFREFVQRQERYSLRYIHLLEMFLHACLIKPHGLDLAHVLTPNSTPDIRAAADPKTLLMRVCEFFTFKQSLLKEKMDALGVECKLRPIRVEALAQAVGLTKHPPAKADKLYKGYITYQCIEEYFAFADVEERLVVV